MRPPFRIGVTAIAAIAVLAAPRVHGGGIPPKVLKDLKAASVYIKVEFQSGPGKPLPSTGSGFVLHVEDGVAYVATNSHVVNPMPGETRAGNPRLVFRSGSADEKTVEGQVVASDLVHDLAIVKVVGFKDLPRPIPMNPDIEIGETMPVYAIGFPFGEGLALGKTNPALTITKGTISSLRNDESGQVKLVQIDAEINPGNSGGPVVDGKGNLLGVAVSKAVKARTVGFAVPLRPLAEMMQGRVANVLFDTLGVEKGNALVNVDAALIDPLGKLKKIEVRFRLAGDLRDLPKADREGKVPLLKDAEIVPLTIEKGKGQGKLTFKGKEGTDKLFMAFQAVYVNGTEKEVAAPAGLALIDFTQVVHADKLGDGDPLEAGKPRKLFTHKMQPGRHYVIEMRSDPKDLDPRLLVRDAKGKVIAEDDGAGGLFDALIVLYPTEAGEYQIVATTNRGTGPFSVRIRQETARELGRAGLSIPDTLRPTDTLDPVMRSPSRGLNVLLKKGKTYAIDMKSKEFDPYLRLENAAFVQLKTEDIGGGGHSTLFFTPFQDGIYRIVATTYDLKTGRFDLSVRETPAPMPRDVDRGLTVNDKLSGLDPIDIANGRATKFRCKAFPVNLKAGKKYQIDMSSEQFDPFLRIEDDRGRELAVDDDSGGMLNARIVFRPKTDGVYRIIATQFDARLGAFKLTVQETP